MGIRIKRIYEPPEPEDGRRVLIDRLWPRGVAKAGAALDEWMKEIAPSEELRKWFGHEPDKFAAFREAYLEELTRDPHRIELTKQLREWARDETVTLLYAARDPVHHHAAVLLDHLEGRA